MKRIVLFATIVSILSILIGLFYIQNIWFTFEFLGPEKGSEWGTVTLWGTSSIIIGAVMLLLAGLVYYTDLIRKHITSLMKLTILLMVIIQLPPLFLWLMFGLFTPIEGLKGFITHIIIFTFLALTFKQLEGGI